MIKDDAELIVDNIFEDIDSSVYMSAMMCSLSNSQKERMKQRWIKIVMSEIVENEWANY